MPRSDCWARLEPRESGGEELSVKSKVGAVYGETVRATCLKVLAALGVRVAVSWNGWEQWEVKEIDLVVPTRPKLPVSDLAEALWAEPGGPPVFLVGDYLRPRTPLEAMHEGAAPGHRL